MLINKIQLRLINIVLVDIAMALIELMNPKMHYEGLGVCTLFQFKKSE